MARKKKSEFLLKLLFYFERLKGYRNSFFRLKFFNSILAQYFISITLKTSEIHSFSGAIEMERWAKIG